MDDRRTAIAIFLSIVVVMIYTNYVFAPYRMQAVHPSSSTQTTANTPTTTNSPQTQPNVTATSPSVAQAPAPLSALVSHPSPAELKASEVTQVESSKFALVINHLGARLTSYKLKEYTEYINDESPVDLVVAKDGSPLSLGVYIGQINDERVQYTLESTQGASQTGGVFLVTNSKDLVLSFSGTLSNGIAIKKIFKFLPHSYLFTIEVQLSHPAPDGSRIWLEWTRFVPDDELTARLDPIGFAWLGEDNKVKKLPLPEVTQNIMELGNDRWISISNKYFMVALIPSAVGNNTRLGKEDNSFFARVSGADALGSFTVYAGPKDYESLRAVGFDLHRNVDLGWFAFLAYPLLGVIRVFYHVLGNYGLAIILLTLLIKNLFLPLTKASFLSMKAMQDLQPEMKALRERIKDPTQLNREMMALYSKHGVNPMGGCLPMLIQIPVFLGLYNALMNSIEMRHAPFALWINDLSAPERVYLFGVGVPVMIIIMGLTMIIQQWMTPTAGDPAQKKAMLMVPVIFTVSFIIFPFPAGLVLYWLTNNLISIIQQQSLRSSKSATPLKVTVVASVVIFCFGYVLTLL